MVPWPAMDAAPRVSRPGLVALLLLAVAALLCWALFEGGGSGSGATFALGTAALAAAATFIVASVRGHVFLPRLDSSGTVVALAAILLVAWTGLSMSWSIAGDRSWDALAKGLVLLAFGVVGAAAGFGPGRAVERLAVLVSGALGVVLLWALLGKVIPALGPEDAGRVARLKGSIGYWNALALLADAAVGCGLWLVTGVRSRAARPAGALLLYVATLVVLLTQSRAGVLAAVVVGALWIALSSPRVEASLGGLLATVPALLVAGWAFTRPALVEDGAALPDRVSDGAALGVLIVIGAGIVLALVLLLPVDRLVATRRREVVRSLAGVAAVVVVVGAVGLVVSVGNPFSWAADQLGSSGEVVNDPTRLGSFETNNRIVWWGEAWQVFRAHPAGGTGARTFEIARKRYRDNAKNVSQPHSLPLQLLSDTGLPGFVLGGVFAVALALGLRASLRRLEPDERAAAVGLVALPVAFGLHALVDYDLDFLAVSAPTVLVGAAVLGAGRPAAAIRGGTMLAAGTVLVAGAAVWVLAAPALERRAVDTAYRQSDAGYLATAAASAHPCAPTEHWSRPSCPF